MSTISFVAKKLGLCATEDVDIITEKRNRTYHCLVKLFRVTETTIVIRRTGGKTVIYMKTQPDKGST